MSFPVELYFSVEEGASVQQPKLLGQPAPSPLTLAPGPRL